MTDKTLTAERLREILDYDPATGVFLWKERARRRTVGARAGSVDTNGYRYIPIKKVFYLAQQLAWLYVKGEWPTRVIRFQNSNTDDCSIDNLAYGEHDFTTKDGRNAYDRMDRRRNKDKFRGYDMKKKFGLTIAEYQQMMERQGGVCAICNQPETATRGGEVKWLAIDHNHDTGAIRELLCQACNSMVGYSRENPELLLRAIAYLEAHAEKARAA